MANYTTTWTIEQQATLDEMAREGYSAGMVARKIGKSRNAVIGRAGRKGVSWAGRRSPDHKAVRRRGLWSEDDLRVLKSMAEACLGARAIALELGRTRGAVENKASKVGIKSLCRPL